MTDHGNFATWDLFDPYTSDVAGMSVHHVIKEGCPGDGWTLFEFEHKFDKETGLWTDMWLFGGIPVISSSYSPESWTFGNNFHLGLSNGPLSEAEIQVKDFCYKN